jgi:hypothetical protein
LIQATVYLSSHQSPSNQTISAAADQINSLSKQHSIHAITQPALQAIQEAVNLSSNQSKQSNN